MRHRLLPLLVALCSALPTNACTQDDLQSLPDQWLFGGERGVELRVPDAYDHNVKTPLFVVLHGYGAGGLSQLFFARLDQIVNDYNVLVAAPDGTVDQSGKRFWNATEGCCDFWDTGVDDLGYLSGLIDEISGVWNVDPQRIYLFGHSNGAYMAYQMACYHAATIAGVVTLAGATQLDPAACQPGEPVSVLHIHGDQDSSVAYEGEPTSPGAAASTAMWAGYNGCASTRSVSPDRLDIDSQVDGAETRVEQYDDCPAGIGVDLWTLEDGGHAPIFHDAFADYVWGWLSEHSKP